MTRADKTDEQLHSQQYAHNPNTTNQNTSNLKHEKLILRFKTKETLSVYARAWQVVRDSISWATKRGKMSVVKKKWTKVHIKNYLTSTTTWPANKVPFAKILWLPIWQSWATWHDPIIRLLSPITYTRGFTILTGDTKKKQEEKISDLSNNIPSYRSN